MDSNYETSEVEVKTEDIQERLRVDYKLFIAFFLDSLSMMATPLFHLTVFARMVSLDVKQSVFAIPRGFAKTTIAKIAIVYIFLFTKIRNIYYISNTLALSTNAVNDIIGFMTCKNFLSVFGKIEFITEQAGKGIYEFIMPNGKRCYIRALGAGQQIRGTNVRNLRIELAVVDDLEDRKDNESDVLYKALKKWFYGDMRKALDKKFGKIIQIGNIVGRNSLVYEHCASPYWFSMHFSAIRQDGTPLWEDLWSVEELRKDFLEYQALGLTSDWFGEMMNIQLPEDSALISSGEIQYSPLPVPGSLSASFLTVDPAISNKATAHASAIVVHGFVGDHWQIVDYFTGTAIDPIRLYSIIYRLATKWGATYVGIESEGYQASLKYVFDFMQRREDMLVKLAFVQMPTGKQHKYSRIATWVGYLKSKEYHLSSGDVQSTTQLLQYDPASRTNSDDLIDAEAYGVYMINNFLTNIMQSGQRQLARPTGIVTIAEI